MPKPPVSKAVALRIELKEVAPLVWRRVLVPDNWTLASLHNYLQWVTGWTDSHAHEFEIGAGLVAPDWWITEAWSEEEATRYRDERRVSVAAVVAELGPRGEFEYRYDMGDGWAHRIVIEAGPPSAPASAHCPSVSPGRMPAHPRTSAGRTATRSSFGRSASVGTSGTRTWRAGLAVCSIPRGLI